MTRKRKDGEERGRERERARVTANRWMAEIDAERNASSSSSFAS